MKWLSVKEQTELLLYRENAVPYSQCTAWRGCLLLCPPCSSMSLHTLVGQIMTLLLLDMNKDVPVVVWATAGVGCGLISNTSRSSVFADISNTMSEVRKQNLLKKKREAMTKAQPVRGLTL